MPHSSTVHDNSSEPFAVPGDCNCRTLVLTAARLCLCVGRAVLHAGRKRASHATETLASTPPARSVHVPSLQSSASARPWQSRRHVKLLDLRLPPIGWRRDRFKAGGCRRAARIDPPPAGSEVTGDALAGTRC